MTNQEVLNFNTELQILAEHIVTKKNDNFTLNYAIDANFRRLKPVVEGIQKAVNPELIALEKKAYELAKSEPETRTEGEVITEGLKLLTDEEQKTHGEMMEKYNESMKEENSEFIPYKVKREKIEDIKIDLAYMTILNKILYETD